MRWTQFLGRRTVALLFMVSVLFSLTIQVADAEDIAPGSGTSAPGKASGPQGENWQSIARLPDFYTGIWLGRMPQLASSANDRTPVQTDGRDCLPHSMPRIMSGFPFGFEFLFTPGRVTIAMEDDRAIRRVYIGAPHSSDPDYAFAGDSVGHWEESVLVIDTIAIKTVEGPAPIHIIERLRLVGPDTLEIAQTIYPRAGPVVQQAALYDRQRDQKIDEYYCNENPRDQRDAAGNPVVDTK